jgi:hypothetical protein
MASIFEREPIFAYDRPWDIDAVAPTSNWDAKGATDVTTNQNAETTVDATAEHHTRRDGGEESTSATKKGRNERDWRDERDRRKDAAQHLDALH